MSRVHKGLEKELAKVNDYREEVRNLTDIELSGKTEEFRKRIEGGEALDSLMPEAYAVVREAAKRVLGKEPYDVQVLGAIVLHQGNIAEMKTGEGKTLTATMAVYLNALEGKGVHVVTMNEYLARRDKKELAPLYEFLGMTVGLNVHSMTLEDKKAAYDSDITYTTNSELGFDYLRDNMASDVRMQVQKELNYVLIDEVDSILIDEARVPLIISGGMERLNRLYTKADMFVRTLETEDFEVDKEVKHAYLTSKGIEEAEKSFVVSNLYSEENQEILQYISKALDAHKVMFKNVDYIVKDGKVQLVDQFTGRVMEGRRYSDGLHQAIETKEKVPVQQEHRTMASITYQNLFRLYTKMSGMTGTAKTEEKEFKDIYGMKVVEIPTNKPYIREDLGDSLYITKEAKFEEVVKEVAKRNSKGQPVLVGTVSIENTQILSKLLKEKGIKHVVLNAKNHEKEAKIIANAGKKGAVTIATNMAGRGTDIELAEGVAELGGLAVIGTERHESRRIDNQLRGRSGRQGDPGVSKFYVSLEDDLMVRFGSDKVKSFLQSKGLNEEDVNLDNKVMLRQVEVAQKRVEGSNYDSRKNTKKYDDVIKAQREMMYAQRNEVLNGIEDEVTYLNNLIEDVVKGSIKGKDWLKADKRKEVVMRLYGDTSSEKQTEVLGLDTLKDYLEQVKKDALGNYKVVENTVGAKALILGVADNKWMNHVDSMEQLKAFVGYQAYGQNDPEAMYQVEGARMFNEMVQEVKEGIVAGLVTGKVR